METIRGAGQSLYENQGGSPEAWFLGLILGPCRALLGRRRSKATAVPRTGNCLIDQAPDQPPAGRRQQTGEMPVLDPTGVDESPEI
jgi:hypothetical protein